MIIVSLNGYDVPQTFAVTQLTEKHHQQLIPTTKMAHIAVAAVFF